MIQNRQTLSSLFTCDGLLYKHWLATNPATRAGIMGTVCLGDSIASAI